MSNLKKIFILSIFYLLLSNISFAKINFEIIKKINNDIITTYDLEKEINYLLALNPQLDKIDQIKLVQIANKSLTKEIIRKNEIEKYKELNLQSDQIDNVLNSLIQNLNFNDESQFKNYLKSFDISIDYIKKKIAIENEWKNLIYSRYINSVKIDRKKLKQKINNSIEDKYQLEYNLSEIVFTKKKDISINELKREINESINTIGFENTANIYSISDSSKIGGKIGWISKSNLSNEINSKIKNLDENTFSDPITIGNNFIIIKVNEIKKTTLKINEQEELDKMILIETTNQLEKFSEIFYNKIKLNSKISEF